MKKSLLTLFGIAFLLPILVSAASCPNLTLTRNLYFGSRGTDVMQLQHFLISQSLLAAENDSGYLGRLTESAVKQFQCKNMKLCSGSSSSNGYGAAGPRTRAAIANTCSSVVPPSNPTNTSNPSNSLIESLLAQIRTLQQQMAAMQNATSTAQPPPQATPQTASCNFNGQTIAHGSSVNAYQSSYVQSGQTCAMQSRTCSNGSLSGTYPYSACQILPVQQQPTTPGIFNIKDYGAKCDGATDDTAAIQAAENARETAGGGSLNFPAGYCVISGTIFIKKGGVVQGNGAGTNGAPDSAASVIRTSSASADAFHIITPDAITMRDFQIDSGNMYKTAGTAILVEPSTSPYGAAMNRQSRIQNISIHQFANGIALYNSANFSLRDNFIQDFHNIGIYITENETVVDMGDAIISGNTVWDLNTGNSAAGIRLDPAAGIAINSNKILGSIRGIWLTVSQGPTGTLNISNNSIEQQNVSGVYVEQSAPGKKYANLTITGNEISLIGKPQAQSGITLAASPSDAYLSNVIISSNVFNMSLDQLAIIHISAGDGVNISGNVLNNLGHTGAVGIITDNQATNVTISGNTFSQLPSGNYGPLTAGTVVQN